MDGGGLGSCQRPRVRVRRRGDTPGRARREGGVSSCCGRGAAALHPPLCRRLKPPGPAPQSTPECGDRGRPQPARAGESRDVPAPSTFKIQCFKSAFTPVRPHRAPTRDREI